MILYDVDRTTASLTEIANLSENGVITIINSIGINPIDNFMYGIQPGSPYRFYRVGRNGNVEFLGFITGLSGSNQAGAFDIHGNYYVTGSSQRLYRIDVNTRVATLVGTTNVTVSDIAIDPSNGDIFGWRRDPERLVRINPTNANVTILVQLIHSMVVLEHYTMILIMVL